MALPPCGIYRTTEDIGGVPAGRLVYFHNHGNPGPGIYVPEGWHLNRAQFSQQGTTLPEESLADTLEALSPEGLYRVTEELTCCEKRCRTFPAGMLVQLGYNGGAEPILFVPTWADTGLSIPDKGQLIDVERVTQLEPLRVADNRKKAAMEELH